MTLLFVWPFRTDPAAMRAAQSSATGPRPTTAVAFSALLRAQAVTWAWAGISAEQHRPPGPKEARALLAVDLRSTVLLAFRPDKNAPAARL